MSEVVVRATQVVGAGFRSQIRRARRDLRHVSRVARTLLIAPATVNPILSRVTACCMLLLVLSPFTAPFRTCDLAALFGATPAQHVPLNRPGPATLNIDTAVANIPALTRPGRVRLIEVSTTSGAPCDLVRSAASHKRPAAMPGGARESLVSTTILRV